MARELGPEGCFQLIHFWILDILNAEDDMEHDYHVSLAHQVGYREQNFEKIALGNRSVLDKFITLSNRPSEASSGATYRNQGAQQSQQGQQNQEMNIQNRGTGDNASRQQFPRSNESSGTAGYFRKTNVKYYR